MAEQEQETSAPCSRMARSQPAPTRGRRGRRDLTPSGPGGGAAALNAAAGVPESHAITERNPARRFARLGGRHVQLIVGVILVVVLVGAVVVGRRYRARQPAPEQGAQPRAKAWSTREERGTAPRSDHGPGHQDGVRHGRTERREPDEWPAGERRRRPREMKGFGNFGSHGVGEAGAPGGSARAERDPRPPADPR
ncbi:DUF6479 family protein [Streptomyces sp. MI02-7b]|uniref:DUF6479 family protein n=1 Tax=Streptomyces sp. MI02-7b TaxID=462941 RepID=UPI0039F48CA1